MSELDDLLAALRDQPVHAGLAAIDGSVLTGLAHRREAAVSRRGMALAGLVAIAVGASTNLMPGAAIAAEPLLSVPANAPSHLLAD